MSAQTGAARPGILSPHDENFWSNGYMTSYRERLWPAAWMYLALALVIPATLLVFLPINPTVGAVTAVVLYAGCIALLLMTAPVIAVSQTHLMAGRASLPLELTGELSTFEGQDATAERGPRLDARAWLLIRGWVSPVVKVEVVDELDPAPYWLLSTRRPNQLVEAIETARSGR